MTPFTRTLAAGLPLALGAGLYIGNLTVNTAHNIADAQAERMTLEITPTAYKAPLKRAKAKNKYTIDAFEDGSGWLLRNGKKVYTFDSDMLPWDCTENGNAICGPDAPAEVRGYRCTEFFYNPTSTVIRYCTDGKVTTRPGNDADAEGEQIG